MYMTSELSISYSRTSIHVFFSCKNWRYIVYETIIRKMIWNNNNNKWHRISKFVTPQACVSQIKLVHMWLFFRRVSSTQNIWSQSVSEVSYRHMNLPLPPHIWLHCHSAQTVLYSIHSDWDTNNQQPDDKGAFKKQLYNPEYFAFCGWRYTGCDWCGCCCPAGPTEKV